MKVKICGVRSYEDACQALDAGAWALGFIFHRPAKRYIEPEAVASIVKRLPEDALPIGVFVDYPLDELNAVVETAGLRGAQLHGDEDAAYAGEVKAEIVIKSLRVGPDFDPGRVRDFPAQRILLDTYHPQAAGGTGRTFDWSLACRAGELAPVILAGGIHPDNVVDSLRQARPDAIDVSSGVEKAPGIKDPAKILRLFEAIGEYERTEG